MSTYNDLVGFYAKFLGSGDATDPVVATAIRDQMCLEAFLEYYARFGKTFQYTANVSSANNNITFASAVADGMWIEVEQMERLSGSDFIPLKRSTWAGVLLQAGTEGATGPPDEYGYSLSARSLSANTSTYIASVYPIPDQSYTYRVRVKSFIFPDPSASPAVDLPLGVTEVDWVARIAAARTGEVLGYGDEWVREMEAPLPEQVKRVLDIDDYMRWQFSEPRRVGELVGGRV